MLNRDGVRKYSYNNVRQILANVEFQESVGCIVPQSLGVEVTGNGKTLKIAKAGTPVVIDLQNITTPVFSPTADIYAFTSYDSAEKTTQYGTGKVAILSQSATSTTVKVIENSVEGWVGKVFSINATSYDPAEVYQLYENGQPIDVWVTLDEKIVTGTPANAVLLHDVDVTDGMANGTACIFGFVNLNRVDSDVKAAILSAFSAAGASKLLTFMAV